MRDALEELSIALEETGLVVRGWCVDEVRHTAKFENHEARIVLIGNVGGAFWSLFQQSDFKGENALDRWTKHVLDPIAHRLGCVALYPSDQPYQPFQNWAAKAEGLKASPLSFLMHPTYGLWHAYRAAFVFAGESFSPSSISKQPHPSDSCRDKPCLSTCPVGAFTNEGYDVPRCVSHVVSKEGGVCSKGGCLARQACPVGVEYRYAEAQQQFHMKAFVEARE